MDVLNVGDKKYVKASVLARELGYTSDYVGQLCRGGKVDAKLVGRSWYVEKDSINDHKGSRYRSTKATTVKVLTKDIEANENTGTKVAINSHFYSHSTIRPEPRYVADETELIPKVGVVEKKSGHLKVDLADASKVSIKRDSDKYVFHTPELPKIKFKGSLSVVGYEDGERIPDEGEVILHAKEVEELKHHKRAINKVISSKPVFEKKSDGALHLSPVDLDVDENTHVAIGTQETLVESPISKITLSLSVVFSCILVILILGLETHLVFSDEIVATSFSFDLSNLKASLLEVL